MYFFAWPFYIIAALPYLAIYASIFIVYVSYYIIEWFLYFEHVMFWLPLANPLLQVMLPPLAAYFYFVPDTTWTKPELFPTTYPGTLYTWMMGKILFVGTYVVLPMTFFGHPLNYTLWDEFNKFIYEDYSAVTSFDAAMMMIATWMTLPYMVPFAWANDFYMWYLQIPLEYYLWSQSSIHRQIHFDKNCQYDHDNWDAYRECMQNMFL